MENRAFPIRPLTNEETIVENARYNEGEDEG